MAGRTSYDPGRGSQNVNAYPTAEEQANQANLEREKEIRKILDEVTEMYSPGGSFMSGQEGQITRQKEKDLASSTQALISSGLYGSTMTAGLPKKWEEEVGMPQRARLEDIRTQAYSGALGQKAGFIERIEDRAPDQGLMADLYAQGASAPSYGNEPLSDWMDAFSGGGMSGNYFSGGNVSKAPAKQTSSYNPLMSAPNNSQESYWAKQQKERDAWQRAHDERQANKSGEVYEQARGTDQYGSFYMMSDGSIVRNDDPTIGGVKRISGKSPKGKKSVV